MSETNQGQSVPTIFTVLIVLLILFVSVQAWYIFEMKKQLDLIQNPQSSAQSKIQKTAVNEKSILKKNHTEANNPEPPATGQLPSSAEDRQLQAQNKSVKPVDTPAKIFDDTSNAALNAPARNPYQKVERMQRDMDRIYNSRFNRFNNHPGFSRPASNKPDFEYHFKQNLSTPKINVNENANQYMASVNLPDANENDISVTLNGQRLTIKVNQEYKKQHRDEMGNVIFQERRSGKFQRSITLAEPVNQNEMKRKLENGVLMILIPKIKNRQWR